MNKTQSWISRFLPHPAENNLPSAETDRVYKYFSKGLSIILIILVLVPLTIISILSYQQYKQLLQKNELTNLIITMEQAESTLERFVSKLQSIIKFIARDDRYQDLLDEENLEALLGRLQQVYPDFADIEIIDSHGHPKSYVGPYQLNTQNYSDQIWYKEVQQRGLYISNVFLGSRQVPHFVIAVSRKHPDQEGSWVLRVTIDGKTLQRYIDTIGTPSFNDIFLADSNEIPQTMPQKYGKIGEANDLNSIPKSKNVLLEKLHLEHNYLKSKGQDIVVEKAIDGQSILHASITLKNTPWKLIMVQKLYLHGDAWSSFRTRLITLFLSCTAIAIFVILKISNAITSHIRDANEKRQQLLAEAENANKLASIGRLAAGVAHEINNPLAIINQKTGLVQDYFQMSENFEHKEPMAVALEGIQSSVERCKTITHRLLGFARHTDVQTEELAINTLLQEVVAFLAREASYNQIDIQFDLAENAQNIFSDRSQLQQVFLNITNNAIDAIGSNGQILIRSQTENQERIKVEISDNGPGIPDDVKKRIFEPFFTTKETGKGTGLGLSITYGILKKLGGTIEVESEIGKGTIFRISLPVNHS